MPAVPPALPPQPDQSTSAAIYVFNHIPKTAGTALREALAAALELAPTAVFHGMDGSTFGAFTDFASLTAAARAGVVLDADEIPSTARLVTGHLAPSTTLDRFAGCPHLTVLREPRVRLLSLWLFQRAHTDFMLRRWGSFGSYFAVARGSLADYLREPVVAAQTDNAMVRFLLWPNSLTPPDRFVWPDYDDAVLAAAIERVDALGFTGLVEDPQLERSLSRWLGREVVLSHTNEVRPLPAHLLPDLEAELTDEACALLAARTRIDRQLWDHVAARALPGVDPAAVREAAWQSALERYRTALRQPLHVGATRRLVERAYGVGASLRHRAAARPTAVNDVSS